MVLCVLVRRLRLMFGFVIPFSRFCSFAVDPIHDVNVMMVSEQMMMLSKHFVASQAVLPRLSPVTEWTIAATMF